MQQSRFKPQILNFCSDWLGVPNLGEPDAGTAENPLILHNSTFNPDSDSEGIYDLEFDLRAVDPDGNPIPNADLQWGSFLPFVALDIDDATPGTFHANQFSVGYVFAQHMLYGESNHIYVEVLLDQN